MYPTRLRRGTTLLELATVLAILGLVSGITLPALRNVRDEYAVRSARASLAAGIGRTRAAAITAGSARLIFELPAARFWTEVAADSLLGRVDLAREFGVAVAAGSNAGPLVQLRFDGLGIGRMTSRTFTFRRGKAQARLTVSAYGRLSW